VNTALHFSSKTDIWNTPKDLFDELNKEFKFTLDPCCLPDSALCENYFTPKEDGLIQNWGGHTAFVNPPYSRNLIKEFIRKCWYEWKYNNVTSVMLIPAKTDTEAFHKYIYGQAELRFIKGRLKFSGCKNNAPFPSMLVIFKSN
jgi:site-specific DNA-methyltransferase (adenine-specific)